MRLGISSRRALVALAAVCAATAAALIPASPAAAVSSISGKDPRQTRCDVTGWQWKSSPPVAVWVDGQHIGDGFLRYSEGCFANWSRFEITPGAQYYYTIEPWAWEDGKTGTDQGKAPTQSTYLVYSKMVDGRSRACAGAHVYGEFHQWKGWFFFGCA
jgi:hypothetical protein